MVVVQLVHSHLVQHQASIFKQLQTFRKEGHLCDVVVKSCDGIEHGAHTAILCAASMDLQNMLLGHFREASQVQQGQPVEMAASDSVVEALLEYIYGEEPQIELEDSFELLRLAEAYNFPELAAAIEGGLSAALDSAPVATALKVLRQTQSLQELQDACEDKLAAHFELCIGPNGLADFCELSSGQLGRILRRADLQVSREEVVAQALFKWFRRSKDRGSCFGALLHNVDFKSFSSGNLARLGQLSISMAEGPILHDLQREIGEALQAKHNAAVTADEFQPKRTCFRHWSPHLGASVRSPQKVLAGAYRMCCYDGAIYFTAADAVLRWKPGDAESQAVAGRGAPVNGANDLGPACLVCVSPEGKIVVADLSRQRILRFANGTGKVVVNDVLGVEALASCASTGDIYLLTRRGRAVEKLVDETLHSLISSEHLPAELQFEASDLFVTKDKTVYISDSDRILRLKAGETEPVVLGEPPDKVSSFLHGLFVTEEENIYVADFGQRKVWAFYPGDSSWTEVLDSSWSMVHPERGTFQSPTSVLVHGSSLYVRMCGDDDGIYECLLPPELQLE